MKTKISLIKLKDLEDAKHPNHIPTGYVVRGWLMEEPTVGKRFQANSFWSTSPVTEIIDADTFKTFNSLYKIERTIVDDDYSLIAWVASGYEQEKV